MNQSMWGSSSTKLFHELGPDEILKSLDKRGFKTTGRILPMNSFENRVYEVEIENPNATQPSENFIIAKYYRPGRWTKEQILEEHEFLLDLKNQEIPVIAPIVVDGISLFNLENSDIYYSIFPKQGGRSPDEFDLPTTQQLGRTLGRIHAVGKLKTCHHRLTLNAKNYGLSNLETILSNNFVPPHLKKSYESVAKTVCQIATTSLTSFPVQRIHGDCHKGNVLWRPEGLFFIDFDDMVLGPPVQDIWLLFPSRDDDSKRQIDEFLNSYEEFYSFDDQSLKIIEVLRALRLIHFSAWIGKRFEDQAFQKSFSWYGTDNYWQEQIQDLEDQIKLIQ